MTTARTLLNFKIIGQGHRTGFSDLSPLQDRAKKIISRITEKVTDGFAWNFQASLYLARSPRTKKNPDTILWI